MLYLKKPSRPPPSRKRDFRGFLREIRLRVCLVGARMRMHEMPRIPCFSACAVMRALCLRAFTRRRSVVAIRITSTTITMILISIIPIKGCQPIPQSSAPRTRALFEHLFGLRFSKTDQHADPDAWLAPAGYIGLYRGYIGTTEKKMETTI